MYFYDTADVHMREFNIGDYGVCFINDMLSDIPEGAFIVGIT